MASAKGVGDHKILTMAVFKSFETKMGTQHENFDIFAENWSKGWSVLSEFADFEVCQAYCRPLGLFCSQQCDVE